MHSPDLALIFDEPFWYNDYDELCLIFNSSADIDEEIVDEMEQFEYLFQRHF